MHYMCHFSLSYIQVIEETAKMDILLKVKRGDKEIQRSGAQEQ